MQTTKATNKLYAGADLHGNNVFLSVCDQDGNNVFRKRVKANLGAVNATLDPFLIQIGPKNKKGSLIYRTDPFCEK